MIHGGFRVVGGGVLSRLRFWLWNVVLIFYQCLFFLYVLIDHDSVCDWVNFCQQAVHVFRKLSVYLLVSVLVLAYFLWVSSCKCLDVEDHFPCLVYCISCFVLCLLEFIQLIVQPCLGVDNRSLCVRSSAAMEDCSAFALMPLIWLHMVRVCFLVVRLSMLIFYSLCAMHVSSFLLFVCLCSFLIVYARCLCLYMSIGLSYLIINCIR